MTGRIGSGRRNRRGCPELMAGGQTRIPEISLERVQSGLAAVHSRSWLRDAPSSQDELFGMDQVVYLEPLTGTSSCSADRFMHQLSHVGSTSAGIQDDFMRRHNIDYFENSRRATYIQQQYAIRNEEGIWGTASMGGALTASNGRGPAVRRIGGMTRRFFGYRARGVPYGPDDGTLAAWAVAASLPFAPEIVLPTLRHYWTRIRGSQTVRARLPVPTRLIRIL